MVDCLWKAEILYPLDKCKHVATDTTPKTLEDLLGFADRKGRRLLGVERAQCGVVLSTLSKADVAPNEVNNIHRIANSFCKFCVESHPLVLQSCFGDPTLNFESLDKWMRLKHLTNRGFQLARAEAVDNPYFL